MWTVLAASNKSSYLKKLHETDPSISGMKYRLDYLFFADVNVRTYSALLG